MSYENQALIESEENALENHEFVSNVSYSNSVKFNKNSFKNNLGNVKQVSRHPILVICALILIAVVGIFIFQSDEEIPSLFNDLIIEATDVQKADQIESFKIAFKEALKDGDIPPDTAKYLSEKGYLVGYLDENGNFVESYDSKRASVLKKGSTIITANDFIKEIENNVDLFDAFTYATYDDTAYYFDDTAKEVFAEIGASRNEFSNNDSFNNVMNGKLTTKNINLNNVERKEYKEKDEDGNEITVIKYEKVGDDVSTKNATAESIITTVSEKNLASNSTDATLMAADELKVADTISQEKRSMAFYATFMENISKMKAGKGQDSQINQAMNFLYDKAENEVVDVKTGQITKTSGSPLESPSLNAILMSKKVDPSETVNYTTDRILETAKNQLNLALASNESVSSNTSDIINTTVASVSTKVTSKIGRLLSGGTTVAMSTVLSPLVPTISSSLIRSSLDSMNGITAGEFLVEGAVNLGRTLAVRGSGATAGDTSAVLAYQKLNNKILAMEAAADRLNRSPFDITSKNTFLGSILYKFALTINTSSIFSGIKTLSNLAGKSLLALVPSASAADEANSFLTSFGQCETSAAIGAVSSVHCSPIATFDTSTLDNLYENEEYIAFVNENTILENGTRKVKPGSYLANFIDYNNNRKAPLGTIDGDILEQLRSESSFSDISSLIRLFYDATDAEKDIATGAAFVNSANNPEWEKQYKYAQRYISMARAVSAMRQFSSDENAYGSIKFHEGKENPIIAYMRSSQNNVIASIDNE